MEFLRLPFIKGVYDFAALAHANQRRKYTNEPYINHPAAVAQKVYEVSPHVEAVCAALLHDVIEDTRFGYDDIEYKFGRQIAKLVLEVTDVSKPSDGNRAIRKAKDREHLAKSSYLGATIKLADLIDNSSSIMEHDPDFAKVYLKEKAAVLEVLKHGNWKLWVEADGIVKQGIRSAA